MLIFGAWPRGLAFGGRGTGEGGGWGVGGVGIFSRGADYLNERSDSRSHSFLNRIAEEIIPIRYYRLFFSDICAELFPVSNALGERAFPIFLPGLCALSFS